MRKLLIWLLMAGIAVLLYFTLITAYRVFSSDLPVPVQKEVHSDRYRIVLISQDLDTPFWSEVERGALEVVDQYGVSLEVRGSFGRNERDFLNNLEIAIVSKVDGIIVQGLDTESFIQLTKLRATRYGIPIITIANDVPANESLRRTYVGSDHREAGRMIARQLLSDMGTAGKVILIASDHGEHFQRERLEGILEVLDQQAGMQVELVTSAETREQIARTVNEVLNREPSTRAYIAVADAFAGVIAQEIGKRYRVEDFFIYSFDSSPEMLTLLKQRKIDALLAQSPADMGRESVRLMVEWLEGKHLPLDPKGYFTDIRIVKAEQAQ
jgi:ribose transport system substrate-binding protein